MTNDEIIQVKAALGALERVGKLSKSTLLNHVGVATCKPLTTTDGELLIRKLTDKEWVGSFTDPVLEQVLYVITPIGRNALAAM